MLWAGKYILAYKDPLIMKLRFSNPHCLFLASIVTTFFLASAGICADELPTGDPPPPKDDMPVPMTFPKQISTDPRFVDNHDGTIVDLKAGLMWKTEDFFQENQQWMNWEEAQGYIKKLNADKFAGYDDWRLPSREEMEMLYEEEKTIPWKYYWNILSVHMDPIFGNKSCCFWTSEEYKGIYAYGFNFTRGQAYPSLKSGEHASSLSLTVAWVMRTAKPALKP